MKQQHSYTSTMSYYRTLYTKYGVDDAYLQTRAQRRAAGVFLEYLDHGQLSASDPIPVNRHKRLKRAFRKGGFFKVISTSLTAGALLWMLQSPPVQAKANHHAAGFSTFSQQQQTVYLAVIDDDEDEVVADVFQQPSSPNISLHLMATQPEVLATEEASVGEYELMIDDDSDVPDPQSVQRSLTVIDTTSIHDWETLRESINTGEVLLLEENDDPLTAMLTKLESMGQVHSINIISHGSSGQLQIDDHVISNETLQQRQAQWKKLGTYLASDGDILLFGCNVAKGERGQSFIENLAAVTGADVAASVDVTGHQSYQGNWDLEASTGFVVQHAVIGSDPHWQGALPTYKFSTTSTILSTGVYSLTGSLYNGTKAFKVKPTYRLKASSSGFFYFNKDTQNAYTFYLKPNGTTLGSFDISDMTMSNGCNSLGNGSFTTFNITGYLKVGGPVSTSASGVMNTGQTKSLVNDLGANFTGFNDVVKLKVTEAFSGGQICAYFQNMTLSDLQEPPPNDDGTVTAAGGVSEPVDLPTTALVGSPVNVFDFAINDGGGDATTVDVSQIVLNLGGTSSGNFSKMRFNLTGCATKTAVAPSGSTVTFPSTGIVVSNGSSVTCTVQAYWNDNTGITDNQTLTMSVDGDADLTVDGAKTTMSPSNTPVTTGNMSTEVIASKLIINTQPAGSVSHQVLTTQPVLHAVDAVNNLDLDYTTSVVASEDDLGSLVGTKTVTPSFGVATFTDLQFNALADQSDFQIDFASSGLTGVTSNSLTSDVVAAKLVFTTEPSPTSLISGEATGFSTVPVVKAVNAGYVIDQGYSTDITLSEVLGPGSATMTGTGDTDADGSTVSITPSSGAATFTGLTITYTNDASSLETFKLRASSGGLITADSTTLTSESLSIHSATYDAGTGVLVVSGVAFEAKAGAVNDVDASKITLRGEAGNTYTLTDTADVEIDSSTQFTMTLSATDKRHVNGLLNADGFLSDDITTYNIAVDDDWMANVTADDTSDLSGNNVNVSNVAIPTITSATYDFSTGDLVVTGTRFVHDTGATNDVAVNKLTLTGEGGATYTLTTSDVEVSSETNFTATLNATDKLHVNGLLNKDGMTSDGGTTYNLAAADNWMRGGATSVNQADLTGNGVTVSNYAAPSATSATYNAGTGVLTVTGTNFVALTGANNDVDLSTLTLTGEAGGTYTLTTATDADVTSATSFSATLAGQDRTNVSHLLNADGGASDDATTYNLALADNWMPGAAATFDIADTTNAVTVSGTATPVLSSATYDSSTGDLVVTGTNFVSALGDSNDVDVSKLTVRGEAGGTYTLTSADVELISTTTFTVPLSTADRLIVNSLLNSNGSISDDVSSIRLSAADDWLTGAITSDDISASNKLLTVFNYNPPAIDSATYDFSTGVLVVTGTNFAATTGATNDVDVSMLTIRGEAGGTHVLTTTDVEATSLTEFSVNLNAADQLIVNGLLNADGFLSDDVSTYRLLAADNWMPGAAGSVDTSDTNNNIFVSNVASPTVTSATYDYSTGTLVVTGTNFTSISGANNDVDVGKITLTGEGGGSYALTSSDVDVSSATSFTVSLNATDQVAVNGLLNKNGTTSDDSTTYNLAAADNWMQGAATSPNIADLAANGTTVSNFLNPAITSATYNASTGVLVVSGMNFAGRSGALNDVGVSFLTLTGEGGNSYTLTSSNVDVTGTTSFTVTLNATDRTHVGGLLNANGPSSGDGTLYNLAAADNWMFATPAAQDIADLTGNGVVVSNVTVPTITSATYNASTGTLVVTGTNFVNEAGASNDVDVSKLSLSGEAGNSYTLTTGNVEISSATSFSVTLNAADKIVVNGLLNKNGTLSDDVSSYRLAAAEDWMPGAATSSNIADLTGNGVTVSGVSVPTVTSATYDAGTGDLVVTGTHLARAFGAADIDASRFTVKGEGGATYTLTDTADVEITSETAFTLSLSAADKDQVNQILNKNGTLSTDITTYILAAVEDWLKGAAGSVTIADTSGNVITVSNVPAPTITSATYVHNTNVLTVTGTGFLKAAGANNDIDVSKLTITGEAGTTYTLTSNSDVDITSGTQFSVTLSGVDIFNAESLLNKDGTTSATSGTTYNLAAAEDWNAGAAAAVIIVDPTAGITVSNYAQPTLTSAAYDWVSAQLTITGTNLVNLTGATNDIDASLLALTGEEGTYTLTDTSDVDLTSATSAVVTLSAKDKIHVHGVLNKNGTLSGSGVTYNLAAADNWNAGAPVGLNIADLTGNGINVTNVCVPNIVSAAYDASTHTLTVTGTCFSSKLGANNDVDVSQLTIVGGSGSSYTLSTSSDVDITSETTFVVHVTGSDQSNLYAIFDQLGSSSSGGTTYNILAADGWLTAVDSAVDITDNDTQGGVSVTINPKITSATYNPASGVLVVSGSNIEATAGATNDIIAAKFTITGEGGAAYLLTNTANVERDSITGFTLTLSATDKAGVNALLIKTGTESADMTSYNLAATDDWCGCPTTSVADISDLTANGITVHNVAPTLSDLNGDTVFYTVADIPVELDSGADATLADLTTPAFAGGTVTVGVIANAQVGEDVLSIGNMGAISTSGSDVVHSDGGGTTIGTFIGGNSGSDLVVTLNSEATLARVRDLLSALQYFNSDNLTFNILPRTVRIVVDDGEASNSTASNQDVTVNMIRAPVIDLDGDDSSGGTNGDYLAAFTEGGGAVPAADSDNTISDDGTFKSLTVTLTNPLDDIAESLSSTFGTGLQVVNGEAVTIGTYDDVTGVLTITIDDGDATAVTLQLLIASIEYTNTSDLPDTTDRSITFEAVDNDDNTGPAAVATLSVIAVNNQPVFSGLDGAPSFTEGGNAVVLDANVTVADVELDAADNYDGAQLTLARNGGANSNDQFSATGPLSTLTEATPVNVGGLDIGTVTTNSTGSLVLTFNNNATATDVDNVLQNIAYSNSSDAPASAVQIDWDFNDGNSGSQGSGGAKVATGSTTVSMTGTNDSPVGVPTISGILVEHQTLTADASGISDADGLGTFSYQWKSGGSNVGTNSTMYTLSASDIGKSIIVTVSYTDGSGTTETVGSLPTNLIAKANQPPTIAGSPDTEVGERTAYGFLPTATDIDLGDTLIFIIINKPGWATFNNATGALSGTPGHANIGVYNDIVIRVSDGTEIVSLPAFSITVFADMDGDEISDASDDDIDGDGMPNDYETENGLNPLDSSDANTDLDGDGISNLDEFLQGTDPNSDNVEPEVTAPDDVTVDATGLFTMVQLGDATAVDEKDGDLTPEPDFSGPFSPGVHMVIWSATDEAGNTGADTQTVNVVPIVSFSNSQESSEGSSATIHVILNGPAVAYPVTVPYTLSGTVDDRDHDLVAGEITIESPDLSQGITVNFVDDGVDEGTEQLVVTMGAPTNAVVGSSDRHIIDVLEGNVAPAVSLTADQGRGATRLIGQFDGDVVVTANVVDSNSDDTHLYDWSNTHDALADIDLDDASFTFDPSGLSPGIYTLVVIVSDGVASSQAVITLNVVAALPILTEDDSDGDGIPDEVEGSGDDDGDGVPNYLDHIELAANVVQEVAGLSDQFLMETEPGLVLTLGSVALQASGGQTEVTQEEAESIINGGAGGVADSGYEFNGGIFDFSITGLPVAGQSVRVVIAQFSPIPANAVQRKLMLAGWQDFVIDEFNQVDSAPGEEGFCPPPGDAAWVVGLTEGHWCVQLTIEDGGPNDADGVANGRIEDPGGVAAVTLNSDNTNPGSSGGGGAWGIASLIFLCVLAILSRYGLRRTVK